MLRKLRRLMTLLSSTALLTVLSPSPSSADSSDGTWVRANTPFTGYWDRFGIAHPSVHHIVTCEPEDSGYYTSIPPCKYGKGDWSLDYYNAPGTSVKYSASVSSGDSLTAQVWAIQPTCSGGGSVAGWTVFVDVYVDGSWEGWISYSHLDQVSVQAEQWISSGQTLGKLKKWSYKDNCWEVTSNEGVHTHFEMWDKYKYACYQSYQSKSYLLYGRALGKVGRTIYTGIRSPC